MDNLLFEDAAQGDLIALERLLRADARANSNEVTLRLAREAPEVLVDRAFPSPVLDAFRAVTIRDLREKWSVSYEGAEAERRERIYAILCEHLHRISGTKPLTFDRIERVLYDAVERGDGFEEVARKCLRSSKWKVSPFERMRSVVKRLMNNIHMTDDAGWASFAAAAPEVLEHIMYCVECYIVRIFRASVGQALHAAGEEVESITGDEVASTVQTVLEEQAQTIEIAHAAGTETFVQMRVAGLFQVSPLP